MRFIVAVVTAVFAATAAMVRAQAPAATAKGSLVGHVVDASGEPIAAATVGVKGPTAQVTVSSPDGRFAMSGLPVGSYEVRVSQSGFAPVTERVRVTRDRTAEIELVLWVHAVERTVVTASRTGEIDVQDTPAAVTVLKADAVSRLQSRDLQDLSGRAPALTVSQNTGFAQVTIRGIGSTAVFAGADPSSAVYVDGVYIARPLAVLSDFLDLERIEVLRGPQGTLYGRNAMGGAVNIFTRRPTNDVQASGRVAVGSFDAIRADGRASGPIVRDRVMASAAFSRAYREGFVRDINHPDNPLGGEDSTAARAKLHVAIERRVDLLISGDVIHQEPAPLVYAKVLAVKPGFSVSNPPDLHEVRTSLPAESDYLQYGAAAHLNVRLPHQLSLTSLTAYRRLDNELTVDGDITELDLTISNVNEYQHQLSQEVTLMQQLPRLTWVGGLFVFDERDHQPTFVPLPSAGRLNTLNPRVDASARAVFANATLAISPSLSATAGLRYSRESKTFENSGGLTALTTPFVPATVYRYTDSMAHDGWTPRFGLQYEPTPRAMTYVSAARGFKSGGFNISSPVAGRGFAPEHAWTYEAGWKSRFAGGRSTVNAAVFVTDYRDLQVQTAIAPGVIDISNAAEATIAGVELETATRLGPLQAGGHLAWLDATYDRYIAVGVGGVVGDVAGRRLNNAPEWSGRVWVGWDRPLSGGMLSLRGETMWQSTVYYTPFNDAVQRQQPYGLLDLSVEFRPTRQPWSIGAFVRNATNEDYITGTFSSPPPAIGGRPGEPRRAGLTFSIGYGTR